jgi:hypothetical protein
MSRGFAVFVSVIVFMHSGLAELDYAGVGQALLAFA